MPKVSIIIPVYNKQLYLENTFQSVLEQEFQDFEVIAVNDGSKDHSLDILNSLAARDCRIRVIDIPNGGVSHARNVGLEAAAGVWIQFLDADDRLEASYLSHAVPAAEEQQADILFSGFIKENERQEPVGLVSLPYEGSMNQSQLCDCFIEWQCHNGFFGFISNKLFRRELWTNSGAHFPEGTTLAEDLDFYSRLYPYVQKAVFWQGNSFYYLQTSENYLCRTSVDYCSQILIHMDIRAWFQKSGLYEKYSDILDKKVTEYSFFILFHHEECKKSIAKAYQFLIDRPEIIGCLRPDMMNGFQKQIISALKAKQLAKIKLLLGARGLAKHIYGVIRKHG